MMGAWVNVVVVEVLQMFRLGKCDIRWREESKMFLFKKTEFMQHPFIVMRNTREKKWFKMLCPLKISTKAENPPGFISLSLSFYFTGVLMLGIVYKGVGSISSYGRR